LRGSVGRSFGTVGLRRTFLRSSFLRRLLGDLLLGDLLHRLGLLGLLRSATTSTTLRRLPSAVLHRADNPDHLTLGDAEVDAESERLRLVLALVGLEESVNLFALRHLGLGICFS